MPVVIETGAADTSKANVVWQAVEPSVVASTEADGYPAINLIDPATWSSWQPIAVPATASYDLGSAFSIDAVGIGAHTLATSGATIEVQSSTNNSAWTTRATSAPLTDDDLILLFPSVFARYWRIRITGSVASIGVFVAGVKLAFPHTPIDSYTPLHHSRQYTKMFNDSIKGAMLNNRVMAQGAETDVDLGFVQRSFVDGPMRAFESHYNQGGTFFYAGWPAGQPLDMGYCRALDEDEIVMVEYIQGANLANLSFSVRAYVG